MIPNKTHHLTEMEARITSGRAESTSLSIKQTSRRCEEQVNHHRRREPPSRKASSTTIVAMGRKWRLHWWMIMGSLCYINTCRGFTTTASHNSRVLTLAEDSNPSTMNAVQSSSLSLPRIARANNGISPFIRSELQTLGVSHTITTSTALFMAPTEPAPPGDETEYKAVMAAFQMYKTAYGNLKIPQRFVVPSMKPWPKQAWGMRLGKVVMHMRATGKYTANHPERKQELDAMGFVWQVRPAAAPKVTLTQVYTALDIYRTINGNTAVQPSFVVPNTDDWPESVRELPLGKSLVSLSKQLDKKANQKWKDRFATLGWPSAAAPTSIGRAATGTATATSTSTAAAETKTTTPASPAAPNISANEARFRKVFLGLQSYRNIYGDLLVPQPFVIPDKDTQWPSDTWGLRLGARVNAIRSQGTFINGNPDRRQMLDDLGFVWMPPKTDRRRRKLQQQSDDKGAAEDGPSSDENFADLFGAEFGFMNMDKAADGSKGGEAAAAAAPKPSWAFEGGGDLQDLAKPPQEENKEDEYLPQRTLQESLDEAVERAKQVGIIEGLTPTRRVIKGRQDKNIPWFNDDFGDDFVFGDVVEALTVYKTFYGDFSNLTQAEDFVIPSRVEPTGFLDEDDDEALATFDVDASARAARAIAKYEEEGDTAKSEDLISAEIERLKREVGLLTEEEETETEEAPKLDDKKGEWPEHLGGMKLGNIVARIRDGSLEVKHIPERKQQLDAIDFDWGDDQKFIDIPFEKAMCAMYAYYMVRGDMFVYEDFVMPDEDPWPQALAGYEIGKAVKRIRELQNFMEAYHPEKVSLLRMIDFVWFPTTALPIDPDEPEMDDELLRLSALGHPDYAKMIDIPMGLPDKIIADGPFYESDNPKHWWRIWHNWEYVKDYWYQQGRRDNAFALRNMGYPRMGDEHEAKYGPGLFKQIEGTLSTIEAGLGGKTVEEKKEILSKLSYYRQEMLGCTDVHPEERDKYLDLFDEHMKEIMKDSNIDFVEDEDDYDETTDDAEGGDEGYEYEDFEYEDEEDYEYEEEFDVEDQLGLDPSR